MSAPSSPPPSAGYVPYLPYKSKRHSRNLSNTNSHLVPNQSPPPVSKLNGKANSSNTQNALLVPRQTPSFDNVDDDIEDKDSITPPNLVEIEDHSARISVVVDPPSAPEKTSFDTAILGTTTTTNPDSRNVVAGFSETLATPTQFTQFSTMDTGTQAHISSSSRPPSSTSTSKKASTFRRLPAKTPHKSQSAMHSRNVSATSLPPRLSDPDKSPQLLPDPDASPTLIPPTAPSPNHVQLALPPSLAIQPASSQTSLSSTISSSALDPAANPPSRLNSPTSVSSSKPAPYRPGFQPKGVYRPLTDEFVARRRLVRDGDDQGGITRVERTKLERRLEKLIALHFSQDASQIPDKEKLRPQALTRESRRASSFFDFPSLRGMDIRDAGDIWRGVVRGGLGDSTKMDIRAAEQRITPWQDDAQVSKCPLCLVAFHPLTNRKHHCRLCGQIICSLPIKHPQRKVVCSTLFVVDGETREIEEVGEGVDYGVKRKRATHAGSQHNGQQDEDKFLKGVRICRQCRPILLRQQYYQQVRVMPSFVRMYENFINLEADIEESLPKFQELLMSLTHHDQPTREASTARKRLLESFARYDKLSKDIRALPCPNGPGSSQDRVQAAVMTRANLFLQKNMFPLQSLPTPKSNNKTSHSVNDANGTDVATTSVDPDSTLAHALQPLLEQETLLESFVEEARAQRKFEDVKTLKVNLVEIRQEIERLLEGKKL